MRTNTREDIAGYTALVFGAAVGLTAAYIVILYLPTDEAAAVGKIVMGALAFIVGGVLAFWLAAIPGFWWAARGEQE